MENNNQDIINTIFPIVSILVAFILSITTYLTSTASPKIKKENLANKIESRDLCALIEGNINIKKRTLKELKRAYIIVGIILLILSGLILLDISEKYISLSLWISLFTFTICFGYFAYKVTYILNSNLDIDLENIRIITQSIFDN